MKQNLSSIELHFLVRELQQLVNARVGRVWQPAEWELQIEFYIAGQGKKYLRVCPPNFMYLGDSKPENTQSSHHLGNVLRSHLQNGIVREVEQPNFERILVMQISSKKGLYRLYFELFPKGNAILTDENNIVIIALKAQKYRSRQIKSKVAYSLPPPKHNLLKLSSENFAQGIKKSQKDSIIKTLASDFGVGSVFAEEIFLQSEIDKNLKPSSIKEKDAEILYNTIKEILCSKINPSAVVEDGKIVDAAPIEMKYFSSGQLKKSPSYNNALQGVFSSFILVENAQQRRINAIIATIRNQEASIKELENAISENTRRGEIIYENYAQVKPLLDIISSAKNKADMAKNNTLIKKLDEKNRKLIIEI